MAREVKWHNRGPEHWPQRSTFSMAGADFKALVFLISVANIPSSPLNRDVCEFIQPSKYQHCCCNMMIDIFYDVQLFQRSDFVPKWREASTSLTWQASWSSRPPLARTFEGSPSTMTTSRKISAVNLLLNSCSDMTSWCWWCSVSFEAHLTQMRSWCSDTKTRTKILSPSLTSRHSFFSHLHRVISLSFLPPVLTSHLLFNIAASWDLPSLAKDYR